MKPIIKYTGASLATHKFDNSTTLLEALILPAQFGHDSLRDRIRLKMIASPQYRLRSAVLEDAISLLQKAPMNRQEARLYKEASDWIAKDDPHWPFSFINICTALDLEPDYLRRKLLPKAK